MRMIAAILLLVACAGSGAAQDDAARTDMIVGFHPGGSDERDFGERTIRTYVEGMLEAVRYSASGGQPISDVGNPALAFLSSIAVDYDRTARPANLRDLFDEKATSLMLMAGTYSVRTETALSTIFLGDPIDQFDLSLTRATIFTQEDFASGSSYLQVIMAYAIIREAERLGLDRRAVANPLSRNISVWVDDLEEQHGPGAKRFPHLREIFEHISPYLQ